VNARNYRNQKQAKETDRLGPKGTLTGSGSTNCPDMDDAQPVERADLTRLFGRMHGTRKPRTSPLLREATTAGKAKPQGTLTECGCTMAEEAKAIL